MIRVIVNSEKPDIVLIHKYHTVILIVSKTYTKDGLDCIPI